VQCFSAQRHNINDMAVGRNKTFLSVSEESVSGIGRAPVPETPPCAALVWSYSGLQKLSCRYWRKTTYGRQIRPFI